MTIRSPREDGGCEPLMNKDFDLPRLMHLESPVADEQATIVCLGAALLTHNGLLLSIHGNILTLA